MKKRLVFSLDFYEKEIFARNKDYLDQSLDDIAYAKKNLNKFLSSEYTVSRGIGAAFDSVYNDTTRNLQSYIWGQNNQRSALAHELFGYLYLDRVIYYFYRLNGPISLGEFVEQGLALSRILAFGRIDWAEDLYRWGKEAVIAKKHLSDEIDAATLFHYPQRMGVFSLELMAQRANEVIDWEAAEVVNIDPLYLQAAREAYHTEDDGLLLEWVMVLADAHVENSATDDAGDEYLAGSEFGNVVLEHLWPYEIHALLKLRREAGRSVIDLKTLDHPLFQQPFSELPKSPTEIWQPRAELLENDLLNKVFAKMAADEPQLAYLQEMMAKVPKTI